MNQGPTLIINVSDGEDNASDLSDGSEPLSKRGKAQSKKKRKKLNVKNGEPSDVERTVEHEDEEYSMVFCQEAPINLTKVKKKKKAKKTGKGDSQTVLLWNAWEEEQERWIDENLSEDVSLDHQSEVMNETAEASSDLTVPLLRYQREWLAWALKQENSATRGGILADEMGMGKTIQAIALVLAKRELHQMSCEPDVPSHSPESSKPSIKGTLVVCPVVAVTQWVSEIDRFTSRGSTKVLVYHGAKRGKSVEQFSQYDFVITTYSIVESEYRKYVMPPKDKCPYCGKLFYQNKLSYHQKYFCGPDAVRTEKQSKQAKKKKIGVTKQKMKESKCLNGEEMPFQIEDLDATGRGKSFLQAVKWQRIILDEVSCDNVLWFKLN